MIIKQIKLLNFRSYKKSEFSFTKKTIIVGNNGAGKSNILEVIYMMATGKSFRADRDSELIRYGEQFLNVQCLILNTQLRIYVDGRKRFEVNGVPRRMVDFTGRIKAVLFGPADIEIITGSPSYRRKYLDFVISQADREYRRCLISYEKGLRQRNKLLDMIRDGVANRSQLFFWDRLLIKDGSYLTKKREDFLNRFNEYQELKAVYDKSVISEERLKKYENEEVLSGSTLVGPHRDDFIINIQNSVSNVSEYMDISKFGSRGQQRMAVLALKMWELKYLMTDELPVLLLDDVYSELDHTHRDQVLNLADSHAEKGGQVIMTTADEHLVPKSEDWHIIKLGD